MLTIQSGSEFLGFGPYMKCPNCSNNVVMRVNEEFVKTGVMYLPIVNRHGRILLNCRTCEAAWNLDKAEAIAMLEQGKESTKSYLEKVDSGTRRMVMKRLNKWGAHDLVIYYGSK